MADRIEELICGPSGPASWPSSAAPAAGVSVGGVVSSIYDQLSGSAGIATYPSAAAPANAVSIAEVLREIYDQQEKAAATAAAVLASGTATIFTIAGGPIEILTLLSVCITANDGTASTLQWSVNPTDGAATTISAASASLASVAAGTIVNINGVLATAAVVTATGTAISQGSGGTGGGVIAPVGVIESIVGVGASTGTWTHHLRYKPLARGVTVT
jgi:hypothetical protein